MFGIEQVIEILTDVRKSILDGREFTLHGFKKTEAQLTSIAPLLVKIVTGQIALQEKIKALEQHIAQERKDDRQFLLSIVQMLHKPSPSGPVLVSTHIDPFEELPVGHKDGYTAQELGLYVNSSQATQQAASDT